MRSVLHFITVNVLRVNELLFPSLRAQAIHSHSANQQALLNQLRGRLEVEE